jgi:hypothetical protein
MQLGGFPGRRPESAVVALLAGASWLAYGITAQKLEPTCLNAWGGGVQVVALLVFLWVSEDEEMLDALLTSFKTSCVNRCAPSPASSTPRRPLLQCASWCVA